MRRVLLPLQCLHEKRNQNKTYILFACVQEKEGDF